MQEREVIVVNGLPANLYTAVVTSAVRYALLSIPFTFNRMNLRILQQKITNIAKGKIAEQLLQEFCCINNIEADFAVCTTPFYQRDKRDFIAGCHEWDVKNNFLYHYGTMLSSDQQYVSLPALIPHSYEGDQWTRRNWSAFSGKKPRYLFTFMKAADEKDGQKNNFLHVHLQQQQIDLLEKLCARYSSGECSISPYTETDFFERLKFSEAQIELKHQPCLVITGFAEDQHWSLFQIEEPRVFAKGVLKTRIRNMAAVISSLPSFLSLHPHLKEKLIGGILRS